MPLAPSTETDDPDALGGYRVSGRLGEGNQGVVYAADDPDGVHVAVKLLHPRFRLTDEGPERFLAAMAPLRGAEHPHVPRLLDIGIHDGRPYVVCSLAHGFPLSVNISGERLAGVVDGTAQALASLHEAGIVHGDVKPGNVLLGGDGPWLLDAGIAVALDAAATRFSALIGAPEYTSPEQVAGEETGPASDVFAWAGVMTFAASGRGPFDDDSVSAVLDRVFAGTPDLSGVPDHLRPLLTRCLAKSPAERPAMREVLDALRPKPVTLTSTVTAPRVGETIATWPGDGTGEPDRAAAPASPEGKDEDPKPDALHDAAPEEAARPDTADIGPEEEVPTDGVPREGRTAGQAGRIEDTGPAGDDEHPADADAGRTATEPHPGPERPAAGNEVPRPRRGGRWVLLGAGVAAVVGVPVWLVFQATAEPVPRAVPTVGIVNQAGIDTPVPSPSPTVVATRRPGGTEWLGYGYRVRSVELDAKALALAAATVNGRPLVAAAGSDGAIRLWDVLTGESVGAPLTGHRGAVHALVTGIVGGRPVAVSGGADGAIRVWDLATGSADEPYHLKRGEISALALIPDGERALLAAATADHTISLIDLTERRAVTRPLRGHSATVTALTVTELDGAPVLVSAGRDESVRIWNPVRGKAVGRPYHAHTAAVETLTTGELRGRPVVVSAGAERAIRVWNLGNRKPARAAFSGPKGTIHSLAQTSLAGRQTLVAGGQDGKLRAWDLGTGKLRGKIEEAHEGGTTAVLPHVDPQGRLMLVSTGSDDTLRFWRFGSLT